jgi:hypothetical protein
MHNFAQHFQLSSETYVLDVGGGWFNWSLLSQQPRLVILNICKPQEHIPGLSWIVSDGLYLPFKDNVFDVVYSNSVIEHLKTHENQQTFAKEVVRVGLQYYIQTPNKWFPIEPHFITPFIHWLPRVVQKHLLRNFTTWGLITRPTQEHCNRLLEELCLLTINELRQLFPDGEIWHERVLGLTKSIIAVNTKSIQSIAIES